MSGEHADERWKVEGSIYQHMAAEIVSVTTGSERGIAQVWKHEKAMSHARLIAAAPDLLAELERMVEHFQVFASDHADMASTETWSALHCAKATIAKATGGTP